MTSTVTPETRTTIDGELASLTREVAWATDLVRRWDDVDEREQLDLVAEWALIQEFYQVGLDRKRRGQFTEQQQSCFDRARDLFREHHSALTNALGEAWVAFSPEQL